MEVEGVGGGLDAVKHVLHLAHGAERVLAPGGQAAVPVRRLVGSAGGVPRVPKRANFFNRAALGDLGAKSKRERPRFVGKLPFARSMGKVCRARRREPLEVEGLSSEKTWMMKII